MHADDAGNQPAHDDGHAIRLPLHPRKAQELFFELLQVAAPHNTDAATPAAASETPPTSSRSLQQRVAHTQPLCADALRLLQRGQWLRAAFRGRRADPMAQLRLSSDGRHLELYTFAETTNTASAPEKTQTKGPDVATAEVGVARADTVALASISGVAILPDDASFVLVHTDTTLDDADALFHAPLEVESEDVLARVAVAIASAVSAQASDKSTRHQQQHQQQQQQRILLAQAIRLRVVEMTASGVRLHDAVAAMERAYQRIITREVQNQLPLLADVCVLRTG